LICAPESSSSLGFLGELDKILFFCSRELDLKRPIYSRTAANGHFGHSIFPWEKPKELKIAPEFAVKLAKYKLEHDDSVQQMKQKSLTNGVFKH